MSELGDEEVELSRQPDGEALYIHFTGGFRAGQTAKDAWRIEPVLLNGKPRAKGFLTINQLQALAKKNDFKAIAFHRMGWNNGVYYSSWSPIRPREKNHVQGPADLWSNISSNISISRTSEFFASAKSSTAAEIADAIDARGPVEALARYISLSLRNMDINVEQIAEHYNEQLVNHMITGDVDGQRIANSEGQTLFAHVHSFFLHLGAARDYLGALVAHRIGLNHEKVDSIARLVGQIRDEPRADDSLLAFLFEAGFVSADPQKPSKYVVAGWMQELTKIRNELVHKRPYGSKFEEHAGWVVPKEKDVGIYRYFRPIYLNGSAERDVLDVIQYHYSICTNLFHQAANASGGDTSMLQISGKDMTSIKIVPS